MYDINITNILYHKFYPLQICGNEGAIKNEKKHRQNIFSSVNRTRKYNAYSVWW